MIGYIFRYIFLYIYIYTHILYILYIKIKIEEGALRFVCLFCSFSKQNRDCKMVPEKLPKRVAAGPWKPEENRFRDSFWIDGASRGASVEKTLATLRSGASPNLDIWCSVETECHFGYKNIGKGVSWAARWPPNPLIFNESWKKGVWGTPKNPWK